MPGRNRNCWKCRNGFWKSVRAPQFDPLQWRAAAACNWPWREDGNQVVAHLVVEHDHARGIALRGAPCRTERGRQVARVVQLVDAVRAVAHGGAGVEQQREPRVGLAAIALEIAALGAREDVPVHVTQVVALAVGAVLGELLAEAEIGRTVQAGDEAVHHRLRHQVQAGNAGQDFRIQITLRQAYSPRGSGMHSRSWRRMSSDFNRSDSA